MTDHIETSVLIHARMLLCLREKTLLNEKGRSTLLLVFDSRTGNTKRFIQELPYEAIQLHDELVVREPFVLVTYTTRFGEMPDSTAKFLKNNKGNLKAVASSGNMNWGTDLSKGGTFGKAANVISDMYGVPVLHKFELSGTDKDIEYFQERVSELCDTLSLTIKLHSVTTEEPASSNLRKTRKPFKSILRKLKIVS